jgi:hypothetical protein
MTKISELPNAGPLTGAELVPMVQNDVSVKGSIGDHITNLAAPHVDAAQDAAAAAAASAASVSETMNRGEYFASVRFPPENGENSTSENGGLYFPGTANLLRRTVAGDAPLFAGPSAVAALWRMPREIYAGIRRNPTIAGTISITNGTTNRHFRMGYVSEADNGNVVNAGKFRARLAGETAGGNVDLYSATVDPATFSYDCLLTLRFDNTNFVLDVFDCRDGTKIAGIPVAKPGAWAGIPALTFDLAIGIFSQLSFPQDHVGVAGHQNIGYARGECGGLLILDDAGDDAQWQSLALGGNPLTIWPDKVRAWAPLVDGTGSRDNGVYQNLVAPVLYNSDLVQRGTILPGGSMRRQSAPQYIVANRMPDPALIGIRHGTSTGSLPMTLTMAGQVAGDEIQVMLSDKAGNITQDWRKAGECVVAGDVKLMLALPPGVHNLHIRSKSTGTICVHNGDIVCGLAAIVNGQSQADFTFSLGMTELGNNTALNTRWDGDHAERCFVVTRGPVPTLALSKPAIFRAATKPAIFGNAIVAFFNTMAKYTDWPIILIDTSVSGTSIEDTLEDADSPDVRDMSDIYALTNLLAGRDASGRAIITAWLQFWHSSGSVTGYAAAFLPPMLYGETVGTINPDDWFYSGLAINPDFPFIHMEPNRIISTTAVTNPSKDSDTRNEHLTRKNLRDNAETFGYTIGAPVDMQRLEGNGFTHPDRFNRYGSSYVAEIVAKSVLGALGMGGWRGPVKAVSAKFTDAGNTAIDVSFTGPAGFSLAVENGGTPTGFEVANSRSSFTAAITGARTVRLTKTSGAWPADATVDFKKGGPGDYGAGFDEAAYINGAIINAQDGCLAQGMDASLLTSA